MLNNSNSKQLESVYFAKPTKQSHILKGIKMSKCSGSIQGNDI